MKKIIMFTSIAITLTGCGGASSPSAPVNSANTANSGTNTNSSETTNNGGTPSSEQCVIYDSPSVFTSDNTPSIKTISFNKQTNEITISGANFGQKSNPYPILWVMGSDVKENGVSNKIYAEAKNADSVNFTNNDQEIWSTGVNVKLSKNTRHPGIDISYLSEYNGWLGWPYANGGYDTNYTDKAYFSYRVKIPYDFYAFKLMSFSNLTGKFDTGASPFVPGEEVDITLRSGEVKRGTIFSLDTNNNFLTILAKTLSKSTLNGATITSSKSQASLMVDTDVKYASTTGGKHYRMWERKWPEGGIHLTRTTNRYYATAYDSSGSRVESYFDERNPTGYGVNVLEQSTNWYLMESYTDFSGEIPYSVHTVNNADPVYSTNEGLRTYKLQYGGLTISNLGWEAAGGTESIPVSLNFGEIYFDNTPQRVIVSNVESYELVNNNIEYQYPTAWEEDQIRISSLRKGVLNNDTELLYMYIFNQSNIPNMKGIPLKNSCSL